MHAFRVCEVSGDSVQVRNTAVGRLLSGVSLVVRGGDPWEQDIASMSVV